MKSRASYFIALISICGMLSAFSLNSMQNSWVEITMKEYDKVMEKAATFFEGKNAFSVDVKMSSFNTHTDKVAFETQVGYFIRSGSNYHQFMLGMHTYQNKVYKFVLDSAEKNIMVASPATQKDDEIFFTEYKQFKTFIKKIEKVSTKDFDKLKVTFSEKFRVSHMEVEMDKSGMLKKSVSFFRIKVAEDPHDKNSASSAPRIETAFLNYKTDIKLDYEKDFSESHFFTLVNGKLTGVKAYKNYYLKDTRLKPTK